MQSDDVGFYLKLGTQFLDRVIESALMIQLPTLAHGRAMDLTAAIFFPTVSLRLPSGDRVLLQSHSVQVAVNVWVQGSRQPWLRPAENGAVHDFRSRDALHIYSGPDPCGR